MSVPGNTSKAWLGGVYAKDVSTMMDIPWHFARVETGGGRIPFLPLEGWDIFRANWCLVGMLAVIAMYGTGV